MNFSQQTKQEVNKVYVTHDLSIFRQIKGNRPPNPKHVKRLCASIKSFGVLQSPIIVNERMEVVDGQHRLLAAMEMKSVLYYIIVTGYYLNEVQVLNLNQKNWTREDFLNGYADMGIESYVKLREFKRKNSCFNLNSLIAMCSNVSSTSHFNRSAEYKTKEVFNEGTWKGRDFKSAQLNADRLKMLKPYYDRYADGRFVHAMLSLFNNENFDFMEFMRKLELQPGKLEPCGTIEQYKLLVEDIYNYRRRDKVSLRY